MQCALRRTSRNVEKVANGGSALPKKSLGRNGRKFYPKEPQVSAIILRDSEQRCFIVTLVTVELDASWKFLAPVVMPLQEADQRNCLASGAQAKLDDAQPVFQSPAFLFLADQQKADSGEDHASSANSSMDSSSSGASVPSWDKGPLNRGIKGAKVSAGYCQKNCDGSIDSSGASGSPDSINDFQKINKPTKRSSKKKVKKKGKQHKKRSSRSTGAKAVRKEIIFDTCTENDSSWVGHNLENAADTNVSFQKSAIETVDNEDSSNDVLNFSVATTTTTSCSDDVDELETDATLPHEFSAGISTGMTHATEEIISNSDEEDTNGLLKQSCNQDDFCSGNVSDACSIVSDSFSDGWNCDGSTNRNNEAFIQSSGMTSNNETTYSNHGTSLRSQWSNVVTAAYNKSCQTKCSGRGCSSSDIQTASSENRGRKSRKSCQAIDINGSTGKDSSHAIWKKIPKSDVGECVYDPKTVNAGDSPFDAPKKASLCAGQDVFVGLGNSKHETRKSPAYLDEMSAEMDTLERLSNVVDSEASSLKSEDDRSWKKVSGKSKRKSSLGSKQEHNLSSRKGADAGKYKSPSSLKMNGQKETSGISSIMNRQKSVPVSSRSLHNSHHRGGISLNDQVNSSSESIANKVCLGGSKSADDVHYSMSNSHAQTTQNRIHLLSRVLNSLEEACQLETDSDDTSVFRKDLPGDAHLAMSSECKGAVKLENDVPDAHDRIQDHNLESISQKWIPVERNDTEMLRANGSGCSPISYLDAAHIDGLRSGKELSLNSHFSVSLSGNGSTCFGTSIDLEDRASPHDEGHSDKLRSCTLRMPKEHGGKHTASNSAHKLNHQGISNSDIDSYKIAQVVSDAYRWQIESEGVQLATGSPLAEFERLLHSASPVLDETCSVQHCNYCSRDLLIGDSLCRHQIPNIPLSSLWQWYERPGSYGLEVRADDYYNSKRSGSNQLGFCAYFVPFLSAVQLFGHSGDSTCTSHAMPGCDVVKVCDRDAFSENMCLPQPSREGSRSTSFNVCSVHDSQTSPSSCQAGACCPSNCSACPCDPDLLFEYFESEQPQQRQPLFEKLKELVRGDSSKSFLAFGDPSKLNSMHLHDLHPSSWYSVAWYPIYRIPNGNFRAAFLTYHSLGHFIRRNTSPNFPSGDACIVAPVMGLQSYNAQGECWFQLRNSTAVQREGTPCLDMSKILKDRLRTLEQTASVMARAVIRKGGQKSMNRHPDYEFFLSRSRYVLHFFSCSQSLLRADAFYRSNAEIIHENGLLCVTLSIMLEYGQG
ncbi:hypothetical protein ACLOJK_014378 [Asimina triloba]